MLDIKTLLKGVKENYEGEKYDKFKKLLYRIIKSELTKKQQEFFYLYIFENISTVEIAKIKGVTKSAVSRVLSRAIIRIRRILEYSLY